LFINRLIDVLIGLFIINNRVDLNILILKGHGNKICGVNIFNGNSFILNRIVLYVREADNLLALTISIRDL